MSIMNKSDSNNSSDSLTTESGKSALVPGEVILGRLAAFDHGGNPLVVYSQSPDGNPHVAVSTVAISPQNIGRQVALLFSNGDLRKPVIMGMIYSPLDDLLERESSTERPSLESEVAQATWLDSKGIESHAPLKKLGDTVCVDGKKICIEGQEEVVIRCGESSITLTKSGKILIRGKYLLSRSSGVNRILGGSVQVN